MATKNKKPLEGEVLETSEIQPMSQELVFTPKTLLAEDIVYIYGILSTYQARTERALNKRKKEVVDYVNDPQYIFDLSEKSRMHNVIKKLFALRRYVKATEDEQELKTNAGTA